MDIIIVLMEIQLLDKLFFLSTAVTNIHYNYYLKILFT